MNTKVITWSELEVDGEVYHITVLRYDEQHVTAAWVGQSVDKVGELGYGVPSCDSAINLAERAIENQRRGKEHRPPWQRLSNT